MEVEVLFSVLFVGVVGVAIVHVGVVGNVAGKVQLHRPIDLSNLGRRRTRK